SVLDEALGHHPDDPALAARDLRGDLTRDLRLPRVIAAAVAVREVDDDPRRQLRRAERIEGPGDARPIVVRARGAATQDHVRARMAAHATRSLVYWGEIGSTNSHAAGTPISTRSSSSRRVIRSPSLIRKVPSR